MTSVADEGISDHAAEQAEEYREQRWRERIVAEVAQVLLAGWGQFAPERGADLGEMEERAQRLLHLGGAAMVERVAEEAAADLPRPVCACCDRQMDVACRRAREPEGLVSRYRLQRTVFVCRDCGQTAVPADAFWGLGPGTMSPALSRMVAAAAAEIPSFAKAAATAGETLGVELSVSTVALTSEAAGAVAEQDRQAAVASLKRELQPEADAPAPPPPEEPPTFLLSVDATKANADKRWRDVKVGVVATLGPQNRPRAKGRMTLVVGPHPYVAGIEPTDDFFYRLLSLLREAGWSPGSPLSMLLIGDGAPFIWNYTARLEALGIRVHEVVDYYHASEHIWKVAHEVHANDIDAHLWGETLSTALFTQGTAPVIAALDALQPRASAAKDEVRKAREYFVTNTERGASQDCGGKC